MTAPPLWIRERDVAALLHLGEAIDVLERGLHREAAGSARAMAKTHVRFGDGHTLHALGASFEADGVVGTKTWAHTGGGATPLLVLWDAGSGALRAVIEAFALGQLRTGGMSGVATRWLAAEGADELALVGSGRQALAQVAAVHAVRPLARVLVYSPTAEHRDAFAQRLRERALGFRVDAVSTLDDCVRGAPLVTTATRALEPFLEADQVVRGAHVNAIGAITPERAELSRDLVARSRPIATDSPPAARALARELIDYHDDGPGDWSDVRSLAELVAKAERRPADADVTLFKAMGSGVADLALATEVLRRAEARKLGRPIEPVERAALRLGPDSRATRESGA